MTENNSETPRRSRESLVAEVRAFLRGLPHRWVFLLLVAAWILLFQIIGNSTLGYVKTPSLFRWWLWTMMGGAPIGFGTVLQAISGEQGHAWLMPLVVVILLWLRRDELMVEKPRLYWPAIGILVLALVIHQMGFMIQQARVSVIAFSLGIYALLGMTWGPSWLRGVFFPFLLLGFCVPMGDLIQPITAPLRILVSKFSVGVAHWGLGIDVIRDGSRLYNSTGTFQYDVAPACSGIRSLVTLLALTTVYGYLHFRTWWKRGLMVLLAFPLAVAGNTLRITCVIVAGESFGQDAGTMIEQKLGFLTFAVALVVVLLIGHWLREDKNSTSGSAQSDRTTASAAIQPQEGV